MTEPIIDPATGKPKEKGNGDPPPGDFVQISTDEWATVKARLDTFEKMGFNVQPPQAATPPAPSGPSFDDQVKTLDSGIEAFDVQIDKAVEEGKPMTALLRERDKLTQQRIRLQIKHEDIDPAFSQGIDTINQLSETVTRAQMPHLDLVKQDYEAALNSMPADQRMNPKIRQGAYNIAVGQNVAKIIDAENEKKLRKQNEPDPPPPGSNSRSSGGDQDTVPKPEDVLSRDTMRALNLKGQTADDYYKTLGYKNWDDYWTKTGKEYFA